MPRRRGGRAGGEAEEFSRQVGRQHGGQSREDFPPAARPRPLFRVHRRSGSVARQARRRHGRLRSVGPHLRHVRAADEQRREPRPHRLDPRFEPTRSNRSRSQTPRPRRREDSDLSGDDRHGRIRAHSRAGEAAQHRAAGLRSRGGRAASCRSSSRPAPRSRSR